MAIPSLAQPPSKPHETYTIPAYSGEVYTIPTSNSVMRLLVTGKETDGAFAVVTTGGTSAAPIGFHYHREAHDVFLCLKGEINVWAGDRCRTLAGGDFASVPPVRVPLSMEQLLNYSLTYLPTDTLTPTRRARSTSTRSSPDTPSSPA